MKIPHTWFEKLMFKLYIVLMTPKVFVDAELNDGCKMRIKGKQARNILRWVKHNSEKLYGMDWETLRKEHKI